MAAQRQGWCTVRFAERPGSSQRRREALEATSCGRVHRRRPPAPSPVWPSRLPPELRRAAWPCFLQSAAAASRSEASHVSSIAVCVRFVALSRRPFRRFRAKTFRAKKFRAKKLCRRTEKKNVAASRTRARDAAKPRSRVREADGAGPLAACCDTHSGRWLVRHVGRREGAQEEDPAHDPRQRTTRADTATQTQATTTGSEDARRPGGEGSVAVWHRLAQRRTHRGRSSNADTTRNGW